MCKLSVIVPIYKTKATLDRCVESILAQDIADMEILLVADGDIEDGYAICDTWASRNPHILAIHRPHSGLSAARNTGIAAAQGELITFVDSDDTLNPGIYKELLAKMEQHPDCSFIEYSINAIGWEKLDIQYKDKVYNSVYEYWCDTRAWNHAYACNKIYRKRVFDEVEYPLGKLYEDVWILPHVLKRCTKIITSSTLGYNYFANTNSLSNKLSSENLKQCLKALQNAEREMQVKWYSYREWNFFLCMLYRQVDIYRISGEIVLHWPFVRLICWTHKHTLGRKWK